MPMYPMPNYNYYYMNPYGMNPMQPPMGGMNPMGSSGLENQGYGYDNKNMKRYDFRSNFSDDKNTQSMMDNYFPYFYQSNNRPNQ
jgi:hypothetical protein